MSWVDGVLLMVLVGSLVVGVVRGLMYEVLGLLGWIVSWMVARAWGGDVAVWLHIGAAGSALQRGAGYVLAFILALLAWRIMCWAVRQILHASPLAPVDRLLGAGFGLLRGLVILLVLVGLLDLTPVSRMSWWTDATSVRQVRSLLLVLAPILPSGVRKGSAA
ncbi:MAG: hypothetical protein RIQ60_833 [Pseudomonadota bacterium]